MSVHAQQNAHGASSPDQSLNMSLKQGEASRDFSELAAQQSMQGVFQGSSQHLFAGASQAGTDQHFEKKVMGLYKQDTPTHDQKPQSPKPNYAFEKKILKQAKSSIENIKKKMGGAANKIASKGMDLTFLLRRLQWLSFYYESVRRQRILEIIKRQDRHASQTHLTQQALSQNLLEQAILNATEQMQDLQTHALQQHKSVYTPYQIGAMVTGVYVSSIVANLADGGHVVSNQQLRQLQQYFFRIHHNQFESANQIEAIVTVPPVTLDTQHLDGIMTLVENPLQAQHQWADQLHDLSKQDQWMQQWMMAQQPTQSTASAMHAWSQDNASQVQQAVTAGQTLLAMHAQQQQEAIGLSSQDLLAMTQEDHQALSASV